MVFPSFLFFQSFMMESVSHENGDLFEVVISGISGAFPESKDVSEFRENLFNKINMVSAENIRWNAGDLHPFNLTR